MDEIDFDGQKQHLHRTVHKAHSDKFMGDDGYTYSNKITVSPADKNKKNTRKNEINGNDINEN